MSDSLGPSLLPSESSSSALSWSISSFLTRVTERQRMRAAFMRMQTATSALLTWDFSKKGCSTAPQTDLTLRARKVSWRMRRGREWSRAAASSRKERA